MHNLRIWIALWYSQSSPFRFQVCGVGFFFISEAVKRNVQLFPHTCFLSAPGKPQKIFNGDFPVSM